MPRRTSFQGREALPGLVDKRDNVKAAERDYLAAVADAHIKGATVTDIARQLNITRTTVMAMLSRAADQQTAVTG